MCRCEARSSLKLNQRSIKSWSKRFQNVVVRVFISTSCAFENNFTAQYFYICCSRQATNIRMPALSHATEGGGDLTEVHIRYGDEEGLEHRINSEHINKMLLTCSIHTSRTHMCSAPTQQSGKSLLRHCKYFMLHATMQQLKFYYTCCYQHIHANKERAHIHKALSSLSLTPWWRTRLRHETYETPRRGANSLESASMHVMQQILPRKKLRIRKYNKQNGQCQQQASSVAITQNNAIK